MAKSPKEYSKLLKGELLELARKAGLPNLGALTKDEIVKRLTKAGRAIEEKIGLRREPKAATRASKTDEVSTKAQTPTGRKPPAGKPAARSAAPTPPTKSTSRKKAVSAAGGSATDADTRTAMATTTGTSSTTTTTGTEAASASGSVSASESTSVPGGDLDRGLPELPEGYADNRLVLLPRDPQWFYSYWDVTNEHKQAARARGGLFLCLRLYDVTDVIFDGTNAHAMWEQEVHELARNWYLHVPSPGRRYCLEIGYRGAEGQWLPLARSNTVPAPVDRPAERVHDEFVTIPLSRPLDGGEAKGEAVGGAAGLHDLLLPPTGPTGLAGTSSAGLQSAWSGAPWSGAWSGAWSAGWSGEAGSVPPPVAKQRGFWLRADAELIVYGATEPGATLKCGGAPVKLAPDGTFYIHLHFPDGVHDFPIEATAVDGEQQRRIRLTFNRRTE
jgi:uncharacterized protein